MIPKLPLRFVAFAAVLWPASLSASLSIASAQAPPRNVVDYYLALPKQYAGDLDRAQRQELIAADSGRLIAKDIANGYVAVSGDAGSPGITVALFKKADGSYLVGVGVYDEMSEDFHILSYQNGRWQNVTITTIPEYSKRLRYELPRYGTTIKVKNQAGKVLYELNWQQDKFSRKVL